MEKLNENLQNVCEHYRGNHFFAEKIEDAYKYAMRKNLDVSLYFASNISKWIKIAKEKERRENEYFKVSKTLKNNGKNVFSVHIVDTYEKNGYKLISNIELNTDILPSNRYTEVLHQCEQKERERSKRCEKNGRKFIPVLFAILNETETTVKKAFKFNMNEDNGFLEKVSLNDYIISTYRNAKIGAKNAYLRIIK